MDKLMGILIEWTDGKTSLWDVDKNMLRSLMKNKTVQTIMDAETCAIIYEK